jgi:hypothetical protein
VRTALQMQARVERLEAEARAAVTLSVGQQIADILSGKPGPRPPVPDEVLSQSKVGRLLLERRQRAEAGFQDERRRDG